MTLGEHLAELRSRLIKSLAALAVGIAAGLALQDRAMKIVVWPYQHAMEMLEAARPQFMPGGPTTPFMVYLKVALLAGVVLASPVIAYQIWRFIGAGLYVHERRFVRRYAPLSVFLFLLGVSFTYRFMLPYGLYFLATYADPTVVSPNYQFGDYVDLVLMLTLLVGITFELPLFMVFFARIGLVEPRQYSAWRRFAIVAIFVVSAVITPSGDPVNLCLMALPLSLLYELGILLSRAAARRHAAGTQALEVPRG